MQTATFGGGCFWCLEAVFEQLQGVQTVVSGFSGGNGSADYKAVCSGETGHAEVVQINFDEKQLSYAELVALFFAVHDPTALNRQGNDVGTQYRSIILHHDANQHETALKVMKEVSESGIWEAPIVTELAEYKAFFPAGAEHQQYFRSNQSAPYCSAVIQPKVTKFRSRFARLLKPEFQ